MISKLHYFLLGILLATCSSAVAQAPEKATVDWTNAKWIGFTSNDNRPQKWAERPITRNQSNGGTQKKTFVSPLMRKKFSVDKGVKQAEVAVSGLGLYELYMNGRKVGNCVLEPAQTTYDKRIFYNVFNVTSMLNKKDNSIALMLGNGFYGQNIALSGKLFYGAPRAILVLTITYKDGSQERIVSDNSWKANSGPILFDNIYIGETYDANNEIKEWSNTIFDDSKWANAENLEAPGGKLVEQEMEPMRKIRKIKPIAILPAEHGWIIDFGQNITGWMNISVKEKANTAIKMQFAELLMPDRKNIDPASTGIHVTGGVQTDYYICKGDGLEHWEPRFTYHGFRYAQIDGLNEKPDASQFEAWLVRTDMDRIGSFKCSDPLINKFYEVSMWTIEDNLQGLLSDCPHRERCAWLGDIYSVSEAANYNFDMKKMWRKTSSDIQTTIGRQNAHFLDKFPTDKRAPANIAVGKRLCLQARPDWGATTVMIPWYNYLYYGDTKIVKDAWPTMEGWIAYLDEKVQEDGIIDGGYGDWCPPGSNSKIDTPVALTSTALYYQSLIAMNKMGLFLGKEQSAVRYAKMAEKVKDAFIKKFFDAAKNSFGSQTGDALAVYSDLVPEDRKQAVADNLADLIMNKSNGHYTTGIFGHRHLYTVLNDYGHSDVVRHLWKITSYPSLGFMTEVHGLTTWPEVPYNWPKGERYRRNSFNHPMHSGFAATFQESLGGIRPDDHNPGFKKFILKPTFMPDIEWVKVGYRSPKGEIKSEWNRKNGMIVWCVVVPKESEATVDLSSYNDQSIKVDGKLMASDRFEIKPGKHFIVIK